MIVLAAQFYCFSLKNLSLAIRRYQLDLSTRGRSHLPEANYYSQCIVVVGIWAGGPSDIIKEIAFGLGQSSTSLCASRIKNLEGARILLHISGKFSNYIFTKSPKPLYAIETYEKEIKERTNNQVK
jgi:hypothetical protein